MVWTFPCQQSLFNKVSATKKKQKKETTSAPQEKSNQRAVPNRNDVPLVAHAVEGRGCQTAERMGVYIDEAGNVWKMREGASGNGNVAGTTTTASWDDESVRRNQLRTFDFLDNSDCRVGGAKSRLWFFFTPEWGFGNPLYQIGNNPRRRRGHRPKYPSI